MVTDYHSIPALSNSSLSVLKRSPAEFYARFVADPPTMASEETDAMRLGSAVHMLALEPERFDSEYRIDIGPINPSTGKTYGRDTKKFADWLKEQPTTDNRKIIVENEFAESIEIAKAFQSHPYLLSVMASGAEKIYERGYEMQYLVEGQEPIRIKCKPDCVIPSEGLIIDLKTTSDPHPDAWKWSAEEYGYHRQAAIYLQAMGAYYGKTFRFLFGVVRSRAPYEVGVYELDDDSISRGWAQVESLIAEYAQRKREDNWRSDWQVGIHSLNVPERRKR